MAGRSNFVDITSALVFVVTLLVCGGLCKYIVICYYIVSMEFCVFKSILHV